VNKATPPLTNGTAGHSCRRIAVAGIVVLGFAIATYWFNSIVLSAVSCVFALVTACIDTSQEINEAKATGRPPKLTKLMMLWLVTILSGSMVARTWREQVETDREEQDFKTNVAKNLDSLDPLNHRITTVTAYVTLEGKLTRSSLFDADKSKLASIQLPSLRWGRSPQILSNLWMVRLVSSEYELWGGGDKAQLFLRYSMPALNPMYNLKNETVKDSEQFDVVLLDLIILGEKQEITGGKVTITVNSVTNAVFDIPPQNPPSFPLVFATRSMPPSK
jgi:hypothetical protein